MPNINTVLKSEVARLARKEIRDQTEPLKKASLNYRRDIASLKRTIATLEKKVALLESQVLKKTPVAPIEFEGNQTRFSAKGLRSLRKRLGVSSADLALLLSVTQQSIYNWENGTSRPRPQQLAMIVALRGMGKRELRARLEQLQKKEQRKKADS